MKTGIIILASVLLSGTVMAQEATVKSANSVKAQAGAKQVSVEASGKTDAAIVNGKGKGKGDDAPGTSNGNAYAFGKINAETPKADRKETKAALKQSIKDNQDGTRETIRSGAAEAGAKGAEARAKAEVKAEAAQAKAEQKVEAAHAKGEAARAEAATKVEAAKLKGNDQLKSTGSSVNSNLNTVAETAVRSPKISTGTHSSINGQLKTKPVKASIKTVTGVKAGLK